eukprot:SAG22_NODE_16_length_32723_cov_26.404825_13_plen_158_part_00
MIRETSYGSPLVLSRGLATSPPGYPVVPAPQNSGYAHYHLALGWLSGWTGGSPSDDHSHGGIPPDLIPSGTAPWMSASQYTTPADGSLPPAVGQPPATGLVCFSSGVGSIPPHNCNLNPGLGCDLPCWEWRHIRAVNCGAFALWELPGPPPGQFCLV